MSASEARQAKLAELMNKAARGEFALKDPETGEKLSPEATQAEISRRLEAAGSLSEEHESALMQARLDDSADVPQAVRSLNLLEERRGSTVRYQDKPKP